MTLVIPFDVLLPKKSLQYASKIRLSINGDYHFDQWI